MGQQTIATTLAIVGSVAAATAAAAGIRAENFNAFVTLTTDYVFRGVSQTREEPAVQGGFGFEHENGFFAGIWGSNVDFPINQFTAEPRDLEIDLFAGYGRDLTRDWSASLTLVRYEYPGADPSFNYNYNEASVALHFRDYGALVVSYTDDALGRHDPGAAYELAGRWPLPADFDLNAGFGLYDLAGSYLDAYTYWNLGVTRRLRRFTFELSYFDTDGTGEAQFDDTAGSRVVLSLTAAIQ